MIPDTYVSLQVNLTSTNQHDGLLSHKSSKHLRSIVSQTVKYPRGGGLVSAKLYGDIAIEFIFAYEQVPKTQMRGYKTHIFEATAARRKIANQAYHICNYDEVNCGCYVLTGDEEQSC